MHNQDASGASSVQAEVHNDDNDSPEGVTGDQGNISKTLWRKMTEPHHRPLHRRPLSSISAFLSQTLIAPMISVPRAALSETHLFVSSKATFPVKRASDSDLIKICGVKSRADGVTIGNGYVSYVSESVGRNCQSSEGVNISLQTTDVVVNNVQIVIESTDDDESSATMEHPVGLIGMDDAQMAIQTVHVSVATSTASTGSSAASTGSSALSLYIDNRRKHVDNIPSTKVSSCSVCAESEHCNKVMNNNNKIISSDDSRCHERIPSFVADHDNEMVSNGKRHVDTDRCRSASPNVTNTIYMTAKQNTDSCSDRDSPPGSCRTQEPSVNPYVAEKLLELFTKVKSRRAIAKMSSDEMAADSSHSTSPQDRTVPDVRVTLYNREDELNPDKISQNSVTAEDDQEAYQKHCTSSDAEVHEGHTNGWPAPGEYHCISLDLCNGHSGHDSRFSSSSDEEYNSSVKKQRKKTSGSRSHEMFTSRNEHRLHQNGSSSEHTTAANNSRTEQTLRSNDSSTEPIELITVQTLEPNDSRPVQTLEPNISTTKQTIEPNNSRTEQPLESDHSRTVQMLESRDSTTEQTLKRNDSVSEQSLEHGNRCTESPTRLPDCVFEPQLDLLTVGPPDLRMSMLRSMLETPSVVHRRPRNDSWNRDKRLSCFVGGGEPLLLRNYLERVGDVIDGGEDEDSDAVVRLICIY